MSLSPQLDVFDAFGDGKNVDASLFFSFLLPIFFEMLCLSSREKYCVAEKGGGGGGGINEDLFWVVGRDFVFDGIKAVLSHNLKL